MKNTIKTNRSAELEAKKAAEAAAARQAELDAIQPKDIIGTMDDVEAKVAHTYRDEEGNARNVTGVFTCKSQAKMVEPSQPRPKKN